MVAITSEELTKQLLEETTTRPRKAKGVQLSKSTGIEYNARLQLIVREINKDITSQLMPLLRKLSPQYSRDSNGKYVVDNWFDEIVAVLELISSKWSSPAFNQLANTLASVFVRNADDVNRKRFGKDVGNFGINVFSDNQELLDYVDASIFDNTRLIKSIPDQYLTQVESIVMTNIRAGGRPAAISKQLQKQFGVTKGRAKMIARDQTAKINGDIAVKRAQSAGFEYFQWLDVNDARVRDRHESIANKVTAYGKGIYRYDNPPLSDDGTPIIPGQDFQCRCFSRPVLNDEVEENQKAGRVNPGVKR